MTFKTVASTIGNGLIDAAGAVHNASLYSQISEIDEQINAMHAQLARLEENRSDLESRII